VAERLAETETEAMSQQVGAPPRTWFVRTT
jgi:hypothetical protein